MSIQSAARANRSCVVRSRPYAYISDSNNLAGLRGSIIFGVYDATLNTSAHMFAGVTSYNSNLNNQFPNSLTNTIGMIQLTGDSNFSLYLGGSIPDLSTIPLGNNFPVDPNDALYRFSYLIPPVYPIDHIHVCVENLITKAIFSYTWRASDLGVTNLLTPGVGLDGSYIYRSTGNSNSAVRFVYSAMYSEILTPEAE